MKAASGRWLVVHVTYSQRQADEIARLLECEGFLVNVQALNRAISGSGAFELRVLASEAEEARRFLMEKGI